VIMNCLNGDQYLRGA